MSKSIHQSPQSKLSEERAVGNPCLSDAPRSKQKDRGDVQRSKPFWVRWGPAVFMMVTIFIVSSIPAREIPNFGAVDLMVKKAGHVIGYGFLALALDWGFSPSRPLSRLFAWIVAVLFAITDEIHQSYVPGRQGLAVDVGIDALGAGLALLIPGFFLTFLNRRKR